MNLIFTSVSVSAMVFTLFQTHPAQARSSKHAKAKRAISAESMPRALPKRKAGAPRPTKKVVPETTIEANNTSGANLDDGDDEAETVTQRRKGVPVDSNSAIRMNYGRSEWNRSSTQVDGATIFLREGATGRIVQIELEETAPDSAVFSGLYSINWRNIDALKVELYAPPQKLLGSLVGRRQISKMIESKELRRLPFVLRRDPITGLQNIELYDNVDQARGAYRTFQAEQELLVALKNKTAQRDQTVDTAKLAMEKAELEEALRNRAERLRISQLETQKIAQALQAFSNLSPQERARRKKEAQSVADQALAQFKAGQYLEAKALFEKAVELDPSNRSFYFQYGGTLYKLDDFNRSLVYLELAEGAGVNVVEKDFYRGLCYYRLKDSASAISAFESVVKANDKVISPSARFYKGIIFFERKRWDEARAEFQGVLDQSSDPALDERSEAYIEQILRSQQFEAERAKKWTLSGTFGLMYDDNVLLTSDSDRDRGSATNLPAYRTLLQGSARYRPVYEETKEWAAQVDALTLFSVGEDFQSTQTISNTDATIIGLTLPWTHKGVFQGKGHKFDLIPGYETTIMSVENNEWKPIFNSYLLGLQNLFVMSETWFTNVNLDLRYDTSLLASSTGDNDSTALKSKLAWSNINFPFADKKQILLTDLAYTVNNSAGKNSVFNRIDMGVGYVRPLPKEFTFNTKLSYFLLTYPEIATGRVDNSYTLLFGTSRKVTEKLTGGFTAIYNINSSNVTANQYKKWTLLLTMTASEVF